MGTVEGYIRFGVPLLSDPQNVAHRQVRGGKAFAILCSPNACSIVLANRVRQKRSIIWYKGWKLTLYPTRCSWLFHYWDV